MELVVLSSRPERAGSGVGGCALRGLALERDAVRGHLVRLGVHGDDRERVVESHVEFGEASAFDDGFDALGEAVRRRDALIYARLGHERDARSPGFVRAPHRSHDDGFGGRDGRVGIAHLRPRDLSALEHDFGLGPEKRGLPDAQVGEFANLDRADEVRHAVRHRGVDGVLGDVTLDAMVIAVLRVRVLRERAPLRLVLRRRLPRPRDHLAYAAHSLRVARHDGDGAHVVQNILRGDGLRADARLGEGDVLGDGLVEVMTHHQHVEVFVHGVLGEGPRRAGGRGKHLLLAADLDDVRRVPTPRALGVVRVDGTSLERLHGLLHAARLVERVGVNRLNPTSLSAAVRHIDLRGRRSLSSCSFIPTAPASMIS